MPLYKQNKLSSSSSTQEPKSICILRLSAIGDVCHAVAAVQAIQKRWPQTAITWVIGKVEYQLLKGLPGVEFVVFDKKAGLKGYRDLRAQLKGRIFDILLHMQVAFRASLATLCIKAREVWGFDKSRAKEAQWLFTNRKIDAQQEPHVADGFLGFARAIGVADDYQIKWEMPVNQGDELWHQENLANIGPYLVISPATSKSERNWLSERYAAVAKYAHSKGFKVVLCGAPSDVEKKLAEDIASLCDFNVINLVGKTSLSRLLVVLKHAQLVITPDSGPAHISVTVNTPVIALYAHSNPKRTGPYTYLNYVVSCYEKVLKLQTGKSKKHYPWGKRVKGADLMKYIQTEQVIDMLANLLNDMKKLEVKSSIKHAEQIEGV